MAQQQAAPNVTLPIQQPAKSPGRLDSDAFPTLTSSPSEDVYFARTAALNQAENDVPNSSLATNPALDESLRKNLRTVNEFIAECEAHLKKHPQDMLAREYLNSAYQQKAELLAAMLDSGRSEQ
jgi:ribosomal protein S15P/S13E